MKIFSVHDSKAEAYLPPIYFKTSAEAIRAFESSVQDEKTQFNKYASDYTLVELGLFDENSGTITTSQIPRILANASEFKKTNLSNAQISSVLNPLIQEMDSRN